MDLIIPEVSFFSVLSAIINYYELLLLSHKLSLLKLNSGKGIEES